MTKLDSNDAKEIGENIGIDWNEVKLDEFTKGVNVELEHGTKLAETIVTNNDKILIGRIAWIHLKKFSDYYSRLAKLETDAAEFWKINDISLKTNK